MKHRFVSHRWQRQKHVSPETQCRRRWPWFAFALFFFGLLGSVTPRAEAADFAPPKPEELAITSLPGYPGAAAVVLYREEIDNDDLHYMQHYERLKILTEDGKKYANVEVKTVSAEDDNLTADSIVGRTIHADGTIIPFTGKPYAKVLEKGEGIRFQEKVFTLPDVEVGSIIEYRYSVRPDRYYMSPSWYIQGDLLVKEAHYQWMPTTQRLIDGRGRAISAISWFPLLPAGVQLQRSEMPNSLGSPGMRQIYQLRIKDVPPRIVEDHMPPIENFSYRVLFNFTPFRTPQEYWNDSGKEWAKRVDKFANPGGLQSFTERTIAGATTPEEKLRKIYAAVMALENTDYTRARDRREVKAVGQREVKDAVQVVSDERGAPEQLTDLFLGMARAAGFKAYAMLVPDRSERLFLPSWLSFSQFDSTVAIVSVDGKEEFFDPGERYCAFGQLAWQHTLVQGIREVDSGTALASTPATELKANHTTRVANLTMDADGKITGKIDLSYTGAPAVPWRQMAARTDDAELKTKLREHVERMVPGSLELELPEIRNMTAYDQPLQVSFKVTGTMGRNMGKRIMLPSNLFLVSEAAEFPHEKRELPVYFQYPRVVQDVTRVNFDKTLSVEAVPSASKIAFRGNAAYSMQVAPALTSVTTRRDFVFGGIVVPVTDYGELRTFYMQLQGKDQESVVLKTAASTTAGIGNPGEAHP